tara:strand:- start:109 stop:966 length:858 start_codon:yes stop_codon:yes gene_type:complete
MLEATTQSCPSCHGTGLIRSDDNLALSILRQIEEEGVRRRSEEVLVRCPVGIANFIMNQKRDYVASIEKNYGLSVRVEGDLNLITPEYSIEKLKSATRVLTESEPALVKAEGLVEISEEDLIEDLKDEDEKPKKRRRRRRKKKTFSSEADADANFDYNEEQASSDGDLNNTSDSGENIASEENSGLKKKNYRRNNKREDNIENTTSTFIQEDKLKQNDITEKAGLDDETDEKNKLKLPKDKNGTKKRGSSKKKQKVIEETIDTIENKNKEEDPKQKRKGWWSLKG